MRTLLLVNGTAGSGTTLRRWPPLAARLARAGWKIEVAVTADREEAHEAIARAVADRLDAVVVFGGDGTVRLAADRLMGSETALGIIPGGTGNGIAYSLGLPRDARHAVDRLVAGRRQAMDVGLVTTEGGGRAERFFNVAGAGLDARVTELAKNAPSHLRGIPSYVFAALKILPSLAMECLTVEAGGRVRSEKAIVVAAANGSCYGRGLYIAPRALANDGVLDICVIEEISLAELASIVPLVFFRHHVGHPKVRYFKAGSVTVTSRSPALVQADGDLAGRTPATFGIKPGALWTLL
jgi:diacylglycerol kinase (ATP)